jgi:tRNA-2-methylthio-N6-dimethylallyladenosine synthase
MGTSDSKRIDMTLKHLTIFLQTFGCQMNKLDSAIVESSLKGAGYQFVDNAKDADVVLINTCSVREHAEQRVLSHLGHLKHIKKSRPDLVVAVIGCMAQRLGGDLLKDGVVDIVCGPGQIPQIPHLLTDAIEEKEKRLAVTEKIRQGLDKDQAEALDDFECAYDAGDEQLPGQAYVSAMRGCDKFCSYCVVPYVRGPEVSRAPALIIEQVKRLASDGVKQVTLLGQRINAYEYKAGDKTYCLADLLTMISDIAGIVWIKFVTSYPSAKYFDRLLDTMANLPKVCKYLHIPAQSGSDKILKAMNRGYTCAEYLELIERAKQIVPAIAIAGDFIVGFPGETDDDFQQTVDLVKKARYKNCFIFKYSPRPGTTADKRLADTISIEVKKQRNYKLLKVQEKISAELAQEFLGKTVTVLVEGLSKKPHLNLPQGDASPQLVARTAGDWIVVFNGPQSLAGQFAGVKITGTSPLTLFGESG